MTIARRQMINTGLDIQMDKIKEWLAGYETKMDSEKLQGEAHLILSEVLKGLTEMYGEL